MVFFDSHGHKMWASFAQITVVEITIDYNK